MGTITSWWIAFIIIFIIVYAVDLSIHLRKHSGESVSVALKWAAVWVSIALLFGAAIYFYFPQNLGSDMITSHIMGVKFLSGYLTEYSLSIDNLFVFIMIFSMMGIKEENQPKLLMLGILISVVLRVLFILIGMELVERFEWLIYIFGLILIYTAYKMAFQKDEDNVDPQSNFLYKGASKLFPIDPDVHNPNFFTKINGKTNLTNSFLCLLVIGSTDVLFAVDSIPAIIGVIKEGASNILTIEEENFLAVSSNVFAVMGLISLYFALKGIMGMFRFLKVGVSFILFFIGAKMLLSAIPAVGHFFSSHSWVSLTVIIGTLLISILLSKWIPEKETVDKTIED